MTNRHHTFRLAAASYQIGGLWEVLGVLQVQALLEDVGITLIQLAKGVLPASQAVVQQQSKGKHVHCS